MNWKDVALVLVGLGTGVAVGWVLKDIFSNYQASLKKEIKNVETWDMKELPDGSIKVVVHRNVRGA